MLNITSAETLFSGIGVVICPLGLICFFIPRHHKFGILSILLGDLFLFISIVFPKKMTDLMASYQVDPTVFATDERYVGAVVGLIIFALWYMVRVLFNKYLLKPIKKPQTKEKSQENTQEESKEEQKKISEPTVSHVEPTLSIDHESIDSRVEPTLDLTPKKKLADPRLFNNLKVNQ